MAKFKNHARLIAKLNKLPAAIKAEIRKPMEKGANDITAMQRQFAPVDTGALRDSINWVYGEAPKGAITAGRKTDNSGPINDLKITIFAGNEDAYYARWVEFGTRSGIPAQPFFYSAFRFMRKRTAALIKRAAVKAIKTVAASKG